MVRRESDRAGSSESGRDGGCSCCCSPVLSARPASGSIFARDHQPTQRTSLKYLTLQSRSLSPPPRRHDEICPRMTSNKISRGGISVGRFCVRPESVSSPPHPFAFLSSLSAVAHLSRRKSRKSGRHVHLHEDHGGSFGSLFVTAATLVTAVKNMGLSIYYISPFFGLSREGGYRLG